MTATWQFSMERQDTELLPSTADALLQFLHLAERLKCEFRHSHTSTGRQESVAEHSWRVLLLAFLLRPYLPVTLSWERLTEMLVIHDLAEARTGDVAIFDPAHAEKAELERAAIEEFRGMLPPTLGNRIQQLWEEFEAKASPEAQVANALDKLEAQVQNNEAPLSTWLDWEKDYVFRGFTDLKLCGQSISTFTDSVISEATEKLASGTG
jgi:putative hydrolases of HD superfamily